MSGPLKVMSYNVRYFGHALKGLASTRFSKRGIATQLSRLSPLPDIVCLQEVETISIRSAVAYRRAHPDQTQLESFMAELELPFAKAHQPFPYEALYFRAHAYRLRDIPIYTTGLAVLVNRQSLKVGGHNVDAPKQITHHHVAFLKDRKQSRICAHVRLTEPGGRTLHVFNTHLSLPTPFTKAFWSEKNKMGFGVNQLEEAKSLSAFVSELAGKDPFIVCGDFNSPPGSPVYQYLTSQAGFVGAQAALGLIDPNSLNGFCTAGFFHLRMHLDHIFTSPSIEWIDMDGTAAFGDKRGAFYGLSDHVPLIGRFRV